MNKIAFSILALLATGPGNAYAGASLATEAFGTDSIADFELKDVVVTDQSGKNSAKHHVGSNYQLTSRETEALQVSTFKNLSAHVPNFYIPDYGSHTTSSIYVRGIGSRMNESSIGFYVDGIPLQNKSSFDFDLYDIANISIGIGPQGTLYGRNSIGGVVDISTVDESTFTKSPRYGFQLSHGNHNSISERLTYQIGTEKTGVRVSGHYDRNDGWFQNTYDREKNKYLSAGGRIHLHWNPDETWRMRLNVSYDHLNEQAYPYENLSTGKINYDGDGSYLRNFLFSGLNIEKRLNQHHRLSSSTGYQYMDDRMNIDQDFTEQSFFTLSERQHQHSFTEELTFRSILRKYNQTSGLFLFHNNNHINSPMTMGRYGIEHLIEENINSALARNPSPYAPDQILIDNGSLFFPGMFQLTQSGISLYHQSSVTLLGKLTLTAGLRAEYERTGIDYNTSSSLQTHVYMSMPRTMVIPTDSTYLIVGECHRNIWQLLPKVSVKYTFNKNLNIYANVSKGYKAGGYNFTMMSSILQAQMQNQKTGDVEGTIYYKPEYLWNYEVGFHSQIIQKKLFVDASVFYIDDRNQQLPTSSSNGSRMITNAERVSSCGLETSIRILPYENLSFAIHYGFTHSDFRQFEENGISYRGKTVPFAPQQTLSLAGTYELPIKNCKHLSAIRFSTDWTAMGKIYWNEENTRSQNFYGLLNGSITLVQGDYSLSGWVRNATDSDYKTFYFESIGNEFAQRGMPITFGATFRKEL